MYTTAPHCRDVGKSRANQTPGGGGGPLKYQGTWMDDRGRLNPPLSPTLADLRARRCRVRPKQAGSQREMGELKTGGSLRGNEDATVASPRSWRHQKNQEHCRPRQARRRAVHRALAALCSYSWEEGGGRRKTQCRNCINVYRLITPLIFQRKSKKTKWTLRVKGNKDTGEKLQSVVNAASFLSISSLRS